MKFVLVMTGRELRASWRRLAFFFVCVAIGVGAIVAVRSVVQQVRGVLTAEARALTAADVVIQTRQAWTAEARRQIEARLRVAPVRGRVETVETATMVRPADDSKAVARTAEIRAVERGFPFYGEVVLGDGRRFSHDLLAGRGALVAPELLTQLGVRVGDEIVIGQDRFAIRGVILNEPGRRLGLFSLGPRVLVDRDDFVRTGLLTFGSRARYQMLLRVDESGIEPLADALRGELRDEYVSVRSYRSRETDINEDLERAENHLSLIGFVILALGGIGVWSVIRVFIQQKIRSIAILKCVGASSRQVLAVYMLQVLALAIGGSLLGVGLAAAALAAVPRDAVPQLANVSYALTGPAVLQGMGVGVLVSMLFSLGPLLDVRRIKPLLLLRVEQRRAARRLDWSRTLVTTGVAAALVVLAIWQASSLRVGLYVSAGFAGSAVVLYVAGLALVYAVRPLRRARWFPLRHAVISLGRPGNQTRVILLAVGLGAFFIIGVRLLQANLLRELSLVLRPDAPDVFLIDIQQDQEPAVRATLAELGGTAVRTLPVLRARVTGVRGQLVNLDGYEDVRGRGSLGREYVVTYRDHLEENERVIDGRFWPPGTPREPEVSIADSIRDRFDIQVGDLMRFDVLGRSVTARVASIRAVDWDDARSGGFMFVFRGGVFEAAPHTYIATLQGPRDSADRGRLQRAVAVRFPNVSVIDAREVLAIVRQILDNVTLAISIVGLVALLSGVLILAGSVAMTKFQRLQETAVFKTLGASTRTIAMLLLLEYGALGVLAGAIGSAGAIVLSWALSTYVFEISWRLVPAENLGGVAVTAALVASVGVLASLDVLRKKPLGILRAE